MILENAPVFSAAGSGLSALYNLDFNADLIHEIPCDGTWQGDKKECRTLYIDNYNNNFAVSITTRGGTVRCPAYSQGNVSIEPGDRITITSENSGIVPVTLFTDAKQASGFTARGVAPSQAVDPYISKVVSLYHMNGNDGGKFLIDSMSNGYGNVSLPDGFAISTAVSKLGGSALKLPYVGANNDSKNSFQLSNTVTFELYLYLDSYPSGIVTLLGTGQASYNVSLGADGKVTGFTAVSANPIPLKKWVHVAAVNIDAANQILFVDGKQAGVGSSTVAPNISYLKIGLNAGGAGFCYVDEVRITNDVARYISDFVPPQVEFPNK